MVYTAPICNNVKRHPHLFAALCEADRAIAIASGALFEQYLSAYGTHRVLIIAN